MTGKLNLRLKGLDQGLILVAALLVCLNSMAARAQGSRPATAEEKRAGKTSQGGAIFKPPSGYMSAEFATFNGVLIIDPKKPAGMFVVYPNEGEKTEALRQRVHASIGKMFIHEKDIAASAWQIKALPSHAGDVAAFVATYTEGETEVQIATYERMENSHLLVYGYFAMRHTSGKGENGRFLDEQGKGVKDFDKLWQSFRGQKK
jgi:hypothetical protein